jgi:hypothetical protein
MIDRLIPSVLLSKEARNFYVHKLFISIAVSIACMLFYIYPYHDFMSIFMNSMYELPMLLTLFAPFSWIIDFQTKKIRAAHWVSLIFHFLFGLVYASLDYYVSNSIHFFLLVMGQALLFWLFTRIFPIKYRIILY